METVAISKLINKSIIDSKNDDNTELSRKVQTLNDLAYYGLIMVLIMGLICYFDENIPETYSTMLLCMLPLIAFSITASVIVFIDEKK